MTAWPQGAHSVNGPSGRCESLAAARLLRARDALVGLPGQPAEKRRDASRRSGAALERGARAFWAQGAGQPAASERFWCAMIGQALVLAQGAKNEPTEILGRVRGHLSAATIVDFYGTEGTDGAQAHCNRIMAETGA